MRHKIAAILLVAVLINVQSTSLAKAESVYDESLELFFWVWKMNCSAGIKFTVSSPYGPFSTSEFTSESSFVSLYIDSWLGYILIPFEDYNVTYSTIVKISLNMTRLSDSVQRKVVADALRRKLENFFQVFLVYSKDLSGMSFTVAEYDYISDVPITEKLWYEFLRRELPGLSQLFSTNVTSGNANIRLSLEKIDDSFLWTYHIVGFGGILFQVSWGQEYTVSLNEILSRTGIINSAPGAHASNIDVQVDVENSTFTFMPIGTEPAMSMTQDEPLQFTFSADVTGASFYDVSVRFKIIRSGADLTMYAAAAVLGVFSSAVGYYLVKKRRIRSSRYGL
jgi:hypothetical protein